jgi:hemolysin III
MTDSFRPLAASFPIMNWTAPHDPVSAWTHGLWMLASLPAGGLLVWRNRGDPGKFVGALIFAIALVVCFGASGAYHAASDGPLRVSLHVLDHLGIYLLIAGTVTPIALSVLRGWWRRWLLVQIWALALAGAVLSLTIEMPPCVLSGFYLAMGWIGVVSYFELARRVSHAGLWSMWAGGLCYSIGAAINLAHWPDPWPGVVGAHELFHLWVMAGSACHYWFMLAVLTPYRPTVVVPPVVDTSQVGDARRDPVHTFQES